MNLIEHLKRAIAFSRGTYGPGERTAGVIDHIRKELREIEQCEDNRSEEWVDVVILGLDGLTRALRAECPIATNGTIATLAAEKLALKQDRNERRDWSDWRTADPQKAIEHIRGGERT